MSDALAQQRIDGIVRALQARGWQDVAVVEEEMGYPFNDMEGEFHYRGGAAGLLRDDASILSPQTSSPEEWIAEFEEKVQDQVLDKGSTGAYDWDWDMFPESYRTMDRVFGYTDSLESAGYILPNGKLLDLSQGRGGRWQDHRAVSPFRPGGSPGTAGMQEFVSEGNVRMDANSGILDMSVPPTDRQKRRVREIARLHRGNVTIDMKDGLGEKDDRDDYYHIPEKSERIEFPLGTNPATIINRIDQFFSMHPVESGSANGHLLKWAQRQQFMLPFYDPNEYTANPVEIQPDLEDFTPEGEDLDEWVTGFYHVTSNLPAVLNAGELKSRRQLGDKAIGLGGGGANMAPDKVSVTHNYNKARELVDMMRFAADVVHGKVSPSQVLSSMMDQYGDFEFFEGTKTYDALRWQGIPKKLLRDGSDQDIDQYLDSNISLGKDAYEFMQDLDEALMMDHEEEGADHYSGFTLPYEQFVKINPDNIGIVQVVVRKDAQSEHVPGELELRFDPDDVMLLQDQSAVLKAWGQRILKTALYDEMELISPDGRVFETEDTSHDKDDDEELPTGGYLYHGTPAENLESIRQYGLQAALRERNDWEEGDRGPREQYLIYVERNENQHWGGKKSVQLRINTDMLPSGIDIFEDQLRHNEFYLLDQNNEYFSLPPEAIDVFQNGKWTPLISDSDNPRHVGRPDFSGIDSRVHGLYAWMNRNCKFLRATKDKTKKNDLGHASWANKDIVFETNVPVEFPFVHMVQETPKMGDMFQQHIDPAGRYMTYNETGQTPAIKTDRMEAQYGMAKFENPLVIVFNTGDEFGYNEHSWKARLNEHYGKSGKALSRAIAADGYDGIVTVRHDVDPPVVSEIVDLRPFAKKAIAWLLRNCRFAQDREQLRFPFYDPSEYEPVVEENLEWPDPLYDQKQALQDMLDDRPQDVANFLKVYASLYNPEEVRFDDAASTKKANPITVVTVEGQRYVVEVSSERFGSMTEIGTWLEDLSEYDLGQYVGFKDFNEEFWDGADGLVLYHATDPDNVEDILRDGLSPRSDSRAMSNRNIGSAVFMGTSPETISSYGDAVIAIDVGAMKANGYMPRASQEEPFEKAHMKEALAHKLGIEEYDATDEYYRNEGLSEDTVVFFGPIPPQYLSLSE